MADKNDQSVYRTKIEREAKTIYEMWRKEDNLEQVYITMLV
jgi:hypothetical protein